MSKTLNKTITSKFFANENGYDEMRRRWASMTNDKETRKTLTSSDYAMYAVLRGKNLSKVFSPVKNPIKLANGQTAYGSAHAAICTLVGQNWQTKALHVHNTLFADLLALDAADLLSQLLPSGITCEQDFEYKLTAVAAEVA